MAATVAVGPADTYRLIQPSHISQTRASRTVFNVSRGPGGQLFAFLSTKVVKKKNEPKSKLKVGVSSSEEEDMEEEIAIWARTNVGLLSLGVLRLPASESVSSANTSSNSACIIWSPTCDRLCVTIDERVFIISFILEDIEDGREASILEIASLAESFERSSSRLSHKVKLSIMKQMKVPQRITDSSVFIASNNISAALFDAGKHIMLASELGVVVKITWGGKIVSRSSVRTVSDDDIRDPSSIDKSMFGASTSNGVSLLGLTRLPWRVLLRPTSFFDPLITPTPSSDSNTASASASSISLSTTTKSTRGAEGMSCGLRIYDWSERMHVFVGTMSIGGEETSQAEKRLGNAIVIVKPGIRDGAPVLVSDPLPLRMSHKKDSRPLSSLEHVASSGVIGNGYADIAAMKLIDGAEGSSVLVGTTSDLNKTGSCHHVEVQSTYMAFITTLAVGAINEVRVVIAALHHDGGSNGGGSVTGRDFVSITLVSQRVLQVYEPDKTTSPTIKASSIDILYLPDGPVVVTVLAGTVCGFRVIETPRVATDSASPSNGLVFSFKIDFGTLTLPSGRLLAELFSEYFSVSVGMGCMLVSYPHNSNRGVEVNVSVVALSHSIRNVLHTQNSHALLSYSTGVGGACDPHIMIYNPSPLVLTAAATMNSNHRFSGVEYIPPLGVSESGAGSFSGYRGGDFSRILLPAKLLRHLSQAQIQSGLGRLVHVGDKSYQVFHGEAKLHILMQSAGGLVFACASQQIVYECNVMSSQPSSSGAVGQSTQFQGHSNYIAASTVSQITTGPASSSSTAAPTPLSHALLLWIHNAHTKKWRAMSLDGSSHGMEYAYSHLPASSTRPIQSILSLAWYGDHSVVIIGQRRSRFTLEVCTREPVRNSQTGSGNSTTAYSQQSDSFVGTPAVHKIELLSPGFKPKFIDVISVDFSISSSDQGIGLFGVLSGKEDLQQSSVKMLHQRDVSKFRKSGLVPLDTLTLVVMADEKHVSIYSLLGFTARGKSSREQAFPAPLTSTPGISIREYSVQKVVEVSLEDCNMTHINAKNNNNDNNGSKKNRSVLFSDFSDDNTKATVTFPLKKISILPLISSDSTGPGQNLNATISIEPAVVMLDAKGLAWLLVVPPAVPSEARPRAQLCLISSASYVDISSFPSLPISRLLDQSLGDANTASTTTTTGSNGTGYIAMGALLLHHAFSEARNTRSRAWFPRIYFSSPGTDKNLSFGGYFFPLPVVSSVTRVHDRGSTMDKCGTNKTTARLSPVGSSVFGISSQGFGRSDSLMLFTFPKTEGVATSTSMPSKGDRAGSVSDLSTYSSPLYSLGMLQYSVFFQLFNAAIKLRLQYSAMRGAVSDGASKAVHQYSIEDSVPCSPSPTDLHALMDFILDSMNHHSQNGSISPSSALFVDSLELKLKSLVDAILCDPLFDDNAGGGTGVGAGVFVHSSTSKSALEFRLILSVLYDHHTNSSSHSGPSPDRRLFFEVVSRLGRKLEPEISAGLFPLRLLVGLGSSSSGSGTNNENYNNDNNNNSKQQITKKRVVELSVLDLYEECLLWGHIQYASRLLTLACSEVLCVGVNANNESDNNNNEWRFSYHGNIAGGVRNGHLGEEEVGFVHANIVMLPSNQTPSNSLHSMASSPSSSNSIRIESLKKLMAQLALGEDASSPSTTGRGKNSDKPVDYSLDGKQSVASVASMSGARASLVLSFELLASAFRALSFNACVECASFCVRLEHMITCDDDKTRNFDASLLEVENDWREYRRLFLGDDTETETSSVTPDTSGPFAAIALNRRRFDDYVNAYMHEYTAHRGKNERMRFYDPNNSSVPSSKVCSSISLSTAFSPTMWLSYWLGGGAVRDIVEVFTGLAPDEIEGLRDTNIVEPTTPGSPNRRPRPQLILADNNNNMNNRETRSSSFATAINGDDEDGIRDNDKIDTSTSASSKHGVSSVENSQIEPFIYAAYATAAELRSRAAIATTTTAPKISRRSEKDDERNAGYTFFAVTAIAIQAVAERNFVSIACFLESLAAGDVLSSLLNSAYFVRFTHSSSDVQSSHADTVLAALDSYSSLSDLPLYPTAALELACSADVSRRALIDKLNIEALRSQQPTTTTTGLPYIDVPDSITGSATRQQQQQQQQDASPSSSMIAQRGTVAVFVRTIALALFLAGKKVECACLLAVLFNRCDLAAAIVDCDSDKMRSTVMAFFLGEMNKESVRDRTVSSLSERLQAAMVAVRDERSATTTASNNVSRHTNPSTLNKATVKDLVDAVLSVLPRPRVRL